MKGDDEMSKCLMNANIGQTMSQNTPGCSDKASFEEQGKASEEETYVIKKPVTVRIVRSPENEEYRIVEEYEEPMVSRIFAKVGKEYGIEASAAFAPFDDLRFMWCGFGVRLNPRLVPEGTTGSLTRYRYEVSDYFQDAPESVLEGFARTAILRSLKHDLEFSEETIRWLNAPEFSEKHRPLFIERKGIIGSEYGEHKSLQEAVGRLVEKGLVERDPSIMIAWTKGPEAEKSGRSSSIMRVVCVNKALDSDDVPDEVVDLVLLKRLALVRQGVTGDIAREKANADAIVRGFPGYDRVVEWLEEHNLKI